MRNVLVWNITPIEDAGLFTRVSERGMEIQVNSCPSLPFPDMHNDDR